IETYALTALDPLKVLLNLPPGDPEHHRPSVRTHARVRRPAQFFEDVPHLLHGQRIVRLDGGMTGHRRGNPAKCFLNTRTFVETFEIAGEGANGGLTLRWIEDCR